MKTREERSKQFFDVDLNDGYVPDEIDEYYERVFKFRSLYYNELTFIVNSAFVANRNDLCANCFWSYVSFCLPQQGFTAAQMQMTEDNTQFVLEREKEVQQIVRSIQDLNEIFKDLATMVVDQVSVNVCHTASVTLVLIKLL